MPRFLTAEVPSCGGRAKEAPEDFEVEEVPAYLPCGEGEHLYLWIEKRGVDTPSVARALARALGIAEREVSYAGLKDRQAVTRQWFSVPARGASEKLPGLELPSARVLSSALHRNKLRTGHLRGNRFRIRLRGVLDAGAARASFGRLAAEGLPNFFGAQRFGARGDNARLGRQLLVGERLPTRPDRFRRRLYLSALQSELFNRALGARLEEGTWRTALHGDVLRKADTGGLFVCREPPVDQGRVDAFEVSPAGPIYGPKMTRAEGEVAAREGALLAAEGLAIGDFAKGGGEAEGGRRAYRVRLDGAALEEDGADLILSFSLPRGSYATVALGELLKGGPATAGDVDE